LIFFVFSSCPFVGSNDFEVSCMRLTCLFAAGLLMAGCAAHAGDHKSSSTARAAAASQPASVDDVASSANGGEAIPLKWTTLKLDGDLRPLIRVAKAGESAEFAFKLKVKGDGESRTLYFGEMRNGDDQLVPVIGTRNGQQYKIVKLRQQWGADQWRGVFSGPTSSDVWGVLDQSDTDEDGNPDDSNMTDEVTLVRSEDGGRTFQLAQLRKPCRKATFADIVMARNGHGRVTLSLAEDCGKFKMGLYHYRTTDGGKSFQRPQFEADGTRPADDVPDDEQPMSGDQSASAR
jgi:hypothetical protein